MLYGKLGVSGEVVSAESLLQKPMQSFLETRREKDWKEVGVLKEKKGEFKLRDHDYLMMYSNVRFTDSFDGQTLRLIVDGRLAWMETYVAFNHTGEWTSPSKPSLNTTQKLRTLSSWQLLRRTTG